MQRAQMDAEKEQYVRQRSARIIGAIAVGAVLLSSFSLLLSGGISPVVTDTVGN